MQSALILGQFVVLRFIVAPAIAYCVYRICETKSIWTAISDMTLILVYYMWIRRGATHKNEPWLSDFAVRTSWGGFQACIQFPNEYLSFSGRAETNS